MLFVPKNDIPNSNTKISNQNLPFQLYFIFFIALMKRNFLQNNFNKN